MTEGTLSGKNILKTQCSCVDERNELWIFSDEFNALFRYNFEKEKLIFEATNIEENLFQDQLYNEMISYGDNLYLFPIYAKGIGVFNKNEKKFRSIALEYRKGCSYYNILRMDDEKVLLYPVVYQKYAYIFDLKSETLEYRELNYDYVQEKIVNSRILGKGTINSKAYFATGMTGTLLEYDVDKNLIGFIELEMDCKPYFILNDFDELMITSSDGCRAYCVKNGVCRSKFQLKYNSDKRTEKIADLNNMKYIILNKIRNKYFAVPLENDDLICLDDNKMISISIDWSRMQKQRVGRHLFNNIESVNDFIVCLPYGESKAFAYNLLTSEKRYLDICFENKIIDELAEKHFDIIKGMHRENNFFNLQYWINCVLKG